MALSKNLKGSKAGKESRSVKRLHSLIKGHEKILQAIGKL